MIYRSKQNTFLRNSIAVLVFSLVFCFNAFSQSGTSTITGSVTDPQGNAVPGAKIALISDQGGRRDVVANDSGVFTFTSVQPGKYQLEIEASGFKKSNITTFQALVDKTTELPVQLEVGQVSETVTVSASGIESIINTQNASLGNNFVSRQIEQLPLQGRNVANLLSLQAAVTPDGSVAGSRSDQANITLDGVDVNEQQQGPAFTPVLRVTPDSIEEFRVTTSNPDASQGRSSGAQISLITKSGTNEFRGALYEYHRNHQFGANSFFNNKAGVPRAKLIRNLFGGRLGGPIVKDRFFFFYNYEGMREAKDSNILRVVPTASLGQGSVRFRDNNGNVVTLTQAQINSFTFGGAPVVDVNPLAVQVFAGAASRYPCNDLSQGDGLNTCGFRFNAPVPVKLNAHTARFDWVVTGDQKHLISMRGNYNEDISGGAPYFPDTSPTNTWSHPLGLAITHTWLINSKMTNRFSYGLTRLAFSNQGDSAADDIYFRNTFSPVLASRTLSRVNPTQNFINDFSWIKGDHSLQLGTNVRLIRNNRSNFARSYNTALTNYSAYEASGNPLWQSVDQYLAAINGNTNQRVASGSQVSTATALAALFGRLSQYTVNFNFDLEGKPLPTGAPVVREFKTEEYDFYVQDVWKFRPNLTITAGLRYGLSRPVYETQGYMTVPNIPLADYLQRRIDASAKGENYTEPLTVIKAGPGTDYPNLYNWDKNNFQPRLAVAWSPKASSGFWSKFVGSNNETVIRAGFGIANDYFGQQLAVTFDAANALGFSSAYNTSVNLYNITNRPAPLYTGPGMDVRTLPNVPTPALLTFPQQQPIVSNPDLGKIETSLDTKLQSPIHYSWNVSYGRKLAWDMYVDVSYIGRAARNLLATRDVMQLNNITDPVSGQTYYQAAQILEQARQAGTPVSQIGTQPYFENIYAAGSLDAIFYGRGYTNTQAAYALVPSLGDWTYVQAYLDRFSGKRLYFQRQYSALSAFGTVATSDYHGLAVSLRQRMKGVTWDLNYTYSKSMDDTSGLQTASGFGSAFIVNALDPKGSRSVSDFDLTHILNFNAVWDIPFGRGRQFGGDMNKYLNAIVGGWQLSSIFRFDTGYPFYGYEDGSGWQTNWQIRSRMILTRPLESSPNKNSGNGGVPNLYSDPDYAYKSYRTPYPGESGDRNVIRYPKHYVLDMGLAKSFEMPWNENHKITLRWDTFNVTNKVTFTGQSSGLIGYSSGSSQRPNNWGNFTGERSTPRIMQFAFRYDF